METLPDHELVLRQLFGEPPLDDLTDLTGFELSTPSRLSGIEKLQQVLYPHRSEGDDSWQPYIDTEFPAQPLEVVPDWSDEITSTKP